ncbi:MAG: DnaJ domain-containing protein [Sphingomonadaceae bacterium]
MTRGTTKPKGGSYPSGTPCASPGCDLGGDYRAPVRKPGSAYAPPAGPPQWQYFCLDHVREFNASWNYFAGLEGEELWEAQSADNNWERETRSFAHNAFAGGPDRVEDALGVLRWRRAARATRPACPLSREDREALNHLGLDSSADLDAVKSRYRELARRYHPDANDGRRDHESRLQALNAAYTHLKRSSAFKQSS